MRRIPGYVILEQSGELKDRIELAYRMLQSCQMCGHRCSVDRLHGHLGRCRTGILPRLFTYGPHFGEEPPLSAGNGSGTIFFSRCNLSCVYCQNFPFSQSDEGNDLTPQELGQIFLLLQEQGCLNINLVSPTHLLAPILAALQIAVRGGLHVPIVYNTNGFETVESLSLLDGLIDIYLPDMRYGADDTANRYSGANNYVQVNRTAVAEMWRQVGRLQVEDDAAVRGLIIRHLVLPEHLEETRAVLNWIASYFPPTVTVSLMMQYDPVHKAYQYPTINRSLTYEERQAAIRLLDEAGIDRGWTQELSHENDRSFLGSRFTKRSVLQSNCGGETGGPIAPIPMSEG